MNYIKVHSLPPKDVIRDIANAMDADYEESCDEFFVEIPVTYGNGFIKGMSLDNGLGLIHYNCNFRTEFEIRFIVNEVHPLKFIYCQEGSLSHSFENSNESNSIQKYQNTIVASKNYNGHILQFSPNLTTHIRSLEINRKEFEKKMDCELDSLNKDLKQLFLDKNANRPFFYRGYYSLELAEIFDQVEAFTGTDFIKKIYIESKVYQILTYQILQYQEDLKEENKQNYIRQSDVFRIKKVLSMIEEDISELGTIEHLAQRVGINVNKLQLGFHHFQGMSVNSFIQKRRLEIAKDLLKNTDYTVSEISDIIGISSKSYFSKTFKQKYTISPIEYRQKNKKNFR